MSGSLPYIRPITELKNTSEISALCHEVNEPIFITKNGYSDLVIMSAETYSREMFALEVYRKLDEAQRELDLGERTKSHSEIMDAARARLNKKE